MKVNFRPKGLPAPIGLLLILIGLIGGVLVVNFLRYSRSSASSSSSPRQIKISNIGGSSFTVSWVTQEKATGLIGFGETPSLGELKKDLRDQNLSASDKFFTHFVLADNLKPETKYYFKIISSGIKYDNSGKLFEVKTGPSKVPFDNDIAQGKILTSTKEPAKGAIVYLSLANTITQSALTDNEGNWIIPLSTARNPDITTFSNYDRSAQVEEILVQGDNETASATVVTGNDCPVPDIILGQSYNFLNEMPQLTSVPDQTKQNFPLQSSSTTSGEFNENPPLSITFPSESEKINSTLPEFLGTGPKEQKIDIKIESDEEIASEAEIDQKGRWSWSPDSSLSPGEHQITVSYTDQDGFLQKVTRSFTILAIGESDLPSFTATPSGQKTTPTPKVSPTPTTKLSPTPSSTTPMALPSQTTVTPTKTPGVTTVTPTKIPRTSIPSTESGTYPSGVTLPTTLFFGIGIATFLAGLFLIIL